MATNHIRLIVRIANPTDVVIITKNCPHSSTTERIAYGQSLVIKMFSIGVHKEMSSSELLCIPPHRIEDITIESH